MLGFNDLWPPTGQRRRVWTEGTAGDVWSERRRRTPRFPRSARTHRTAGESAKNARFISHLSPDTWHPDHVERSLVGALVALPLCQIHPEQNELLTPSKATTFHLSLHHLHCIQTEPNLLMQPRLLIALCIALGQIMLFFTLKDFPQHWQCEKSITITNILHLALCRGVNGGRETAVGFSLRPHHYHAVNCFPAVLTGPNKRPAAVVDCLMRYFIHSIYTFN